MPGEQRVLTLVARDLVVQRHTTMCGAELWHPCRKRLPSSINADSRCIIVSLANVFRFDQGWRRHTPHWAIKALSRMRLPRLETHSWELRSAEKSNAEHPDTFWIPPLEIRDSLQRGQAARLIFDIETVDDNGECSVGGERMWVVVAERHGDHYIGILDNPPASFEPSDAFYLLLRCRNPVPSGTRDRRWRSTTRTL